MISLKDILKIEDLKLKIANLDENTTFSSVVIDSRKVIPGSLFIAIKGERFDGHDFIDEVLKAGARGVLVKNSKYAPFQKSGAPIIGAPDTAIALGKIAGAWRKNLKAKVIGITGSNGKTSTKDMLASVLRSKYNTVATVSNNNNHIGVPLTLLDANEETDFIVCEIGTNHFGEIEYSSKIALPDMAVITNIGESHLEYLINKKGVKNEKEALLRITRDRGGKTFLNWDDIFLERLAKKYPDSILFSMKKEMTISGALLGFSETGLPIIRISYEGSSEKIQLSLYGVKNAENALAVAAIALNCGFSLAEVKSGLEHVQPPKGRMNRIILDGYDLVDDTYNANPESMKSAFATIARDLIHERKIAILGDMFELGAKAAEKHVLLAEYLLRSKFNTVFLTGKNMKLLSDVLKSCNIQCQYFKSKDLLMEVLADYNFRNSIVLVKGSRGMQMETVVKYLIEKGK
jgi:UDP-N-acetylmuramoyl-tripeptide--D-alanyl-D-alanine ligase